MYGPEIKEHQPKEPMIGDGISSPFPSKISTETEMEWEIARKIGENSKMAETEEIDWMKRNKPTRLGEEEMEKTSGNKIPIYFMKRHGYC
jgi:hypothetical protein